MPRTARSGVTIDQVAAAAGVSRATVSRVMNGRTTVSPDIADRVRAAADELSYRPNRVARSLSTGRTNTVALVVPDLGNPMFQQVLRGVTAAAAPHDYRVLVAETAENADDEAEVALEARMRCDALLLAAPRTSDETLRELLPRVEPVVLVNRQVADLSTPTVRVDYASGVRSVVDHLVALGHRDVVYAAGPRSSVSNAARVRALEDAREHHPGLRVTSVPCGSTVEAGYRAADAILASGASAVVAFNDLVAFGLLARLNEAGVAVPEDISVTGFDDIDLSRYAAPSLTSAAVPQADLGRRAWDLLHRRILGVAERDGDRADSLITPGLVVRNSTGPVPPARRLAVASSELAGRARSGAGVRASWHAAADDWVLELADGRPLARVTPGTDMPGVHSPRPALHPVHSLRGVAMTQTSPLDHRHHYGVSMAVPDVNGTSHWGGRTFVRDQGSTLLANHGRQETTAAELSADGATLRSQVRWLDKDGAEQLSEERRLTAAMLPEIDAWALDWQGTLHAGASEVVIGSPATNGRPQAGYGGYFWRLPFADEAHGFAVGAPDESAIHGLATPWVAVTRRNGGDWTTLLLLQTALDPDPWFVRVADYVGLGPSLAWEEVRRIPAGGSLDVGVLAVVVDRRLDEADASDVAELALARVRGAQEGRSVERVPAEV